jgi:hypothetical protein
MLAIVLVVVWVLTRQTKMRREAESDVAHSISTTIPILQDQLFLLLLPLVVVVVVVVVVWADRVDFKEESGRQAHLVGVGRDIALRTIRSPQ